MTSVLVVPFRVKKLVYDNNIYVLGCVAPKGPQPDVLQFLLGYYEKKYDRR